MSKRMCKICDTDLATDFQEEQIDESTWKATPSGYLVCPECKIIYQA